MVSRTLAIAVAVAALGGAALAGPALAAPTLTLRHAAISIVVEPENRSDIVVDVWRPNPSLPLEVRRVGDDVIIDGHLPSFLTTCHGSGAGLRVFVFGRGDYSAAELPQVVVRMPVDAVVESGAIARGFVTRSRNLTLTSSGCGDWTIANVAGQLNAGVSGVGELRTGSAQNADVGLSGTGHVAIGQVMNQAVVRMSGAGALSLRAAGSADLTISGTGGLVAGPISAGLTSKLSGAGGLKVASVDGPVSADVSGVGGVEIAGGHATRLDANVSGVGHIRYGGVADTLDANVSGVGGVSVARVTGEVNKHVAGVGSIEVGGR